MIYLKVPCEMSIFALRERRVNEVMVYLASQLAYSGKAKTSPSPAIELSQLLPLEERTIYKHFNWLINRNWIGKDIENKWYHFRGFDFIHQLEDWRFSRATAFTWEDLKHIKAYFAGSALASIVASGRQVRETDRKTGRSEQLSHPVSLSVIQNVLGVSKSGAYRLRKDAEKYNYLRNEENLIRITNLSPNDVKCSRAFSVPSLPVELLGYSDSKIVPIDRIKDKEGGLFLQEPNLIYPLLKIKSRRGLSKCG